MKISITYQDGLATTGTYTLSIQPADLDEAQHLARRIALEGFFMRQDESVGHYVPASRVLRVTMKNNLLGIVDGAGLS